MTEETTVSKRIKKDEEELAALMKARDDHENKDKDPDLIEAEAILEDKDASEEDKNWAKRYSDTKSAWYKERNIKDSEIEELKQRINSMEATKSEKMPTNVEDLKAWKEQYPEVSNAIQAIATEIATEMQGGLQKKVDDLSQKEQKSQAALTKEQVVKVHPDFDNLNASSAFHDWVKEQDDWVDKALYRGLNPKSIIDAINLYKLENNLIGKDKVDEPSGKTDKTKEVDAAKLVTKTKTETPPDSHKGRLLESEILKWTDEELTANLATYKKARLEGKIIYDVTNKRSA